MSDADPHNWAAIRAAIDADPVARYQEAMALNQQANPNPSAKQLLDAYRAMNGGRLPPGMTPEQAMMIDMGIGQEILAQNPMLMTIMSQIAGNRAQLQQDFQAARAQVGQNYQDLTGSVEQQGTEWMAELAKSMGLTPEQMATDPNVNQYGQTIQAMGATADQNQATDQAWFDKMAQVYDQSSAAMLQQIALGGLTPTGGSGGGGGGYGGRGRGYGGGGSGDGNWTDPKTTDSMTQSADADALRNYPGFSEQVLAMFEGDPEAQESAARYMDMFGGLPHNVAKGLATTEVPTIEAALEAMNAQRAQSQTYRGLVPARAEGAVSRVREYSDLARQQAAQQGVNIPTRDALARELFDVQDFSELEGDQRQQVRDQTQTSQYLTPAQKERFNQDFGITLMNIMADAVEATGSGMTAEEWRQNAPRGRSGTDWARSVNQAGRDKSASQVEKMRLAAQILQARRDKAEYEEASRDPNFTFEGWDGYVPGVDRDEQGEQERNYDIAASVLAMAREFSPNYGWQDTKMTMKDSSDTKTTQTFRDPADSPNHLFNNNISMEMPDDGRGNIGWDTEAYGSFGESRNTRLSSAAQRLIQNRLDKIREAGEANQDAPVGRTEPRNPAKRPVRPSTVRSTAKAPAKKATSPAKKSNSSWFDIAVRRAKEVSKKSAAKKKPAKKSTPRINRY